MKSSCSIRATTPMRPQPCSRARASVRVPLRHPDFRIDYERLAADDHTQDPAADRQHAAQSDRQRARCRRTGSASRICSRRTTATCCPTRCTRRSSSTVSDTSAFARNPRLARAIVCGLFLRQGLQRDRLEGRLLHRGAGADRGIPQGAPVPDFFSINADPVRDCGFLLEAPEFADEQGRFYQARRDHLTALLKDSRVPTAAGGWHVFPAGRLFCGVEPVRHRILPAACPETWRGGDSTVAVLCRSTGREAGAFLLRQAGCNARARGRTTPRRVAAGTRARRHPVAGKAGRPVRKLSGQSAGPSHSMELP